MNQQQPQQPWQPQKFGGGGGQRNPHGSQGGYQNFGGPPQGAPVNMMPPNMMDRVMGPPPPPLAQHQRGPPGHHPPPPMHPSMSHMPGAPQQNPGQFPVGTFNSHGTVMNDDSFWHDPNGDLRKWQRDTGTGLWGDPTKQSSHQIRRWTQVENGQEDDVLVGSATSAADSLKKDDDDNGVPELGWGDLPPLNGSAAPAASHSSSNVSSSLNSSGWMNAPSGLAPQPNSSQGGLNYFLFQ